MLAEALGHQVKVYRAFRKNLVYISLPTQEAEDALSDRIAQGQSLINLIELPNAATSDEAQQQLKQWECKLNKYDDFVHSKREAYKAKMTLSGLHEAL